MRVTLSTLWFYWKRFGHRMGLIQTEIVMALSYLFVFGPGRLVLVAIRSDPLAKRLPVGEQSLYFAKEASPTEIDHYTHQF